MKTEPLDPAQYPPSPEAQTDLLNDALSTANASYVAHVRVVIARARFMSEIAREAGTTSDSLHRSSVRPATRA